MHIWIFTWSTSVTWNGMEWNGFELCFISKSILEIIDLLQTMLMERQYVYVAVCIRYICSCDICNLHIVNYRVTTQDFFIHFLCTREHISHISCSYRSVCQCKYWLIDLSVHVLIDWLINTLIDWSDQSIERTIDWLIVSMNPTLLQWAIYMIYEQTVVYMISQEQTGGMVWE